MRPLSLDGRENVPSALITLSKNLNSLLYQFFDLMVHREDVIPAPEPGSLGFASR